MNLNDRYRKSNLVNSLLEALKEPCSHVNLRGVVGSLYGIIGTATATRLPKCNHLFIAHDKEEALYLLNDIENLLGERDADINLKRALLFPASNKRPYQEEKGNKVNLMHRGNVLARLTAGDPIIIVSYPEALCEKEMSRKAVKDNSLHLACGKVMSMDDLIDKLVDYHFEHVDFVCNPGQFAVRGGIIDVFSFSDEHPYRVEFFGDEIVSLRLFSIADQLTISTTQSVTILPEKDEKKPGLELLGLLDSLNTDSIVWVEGLRSAASGMEACYSNARKEYERIDPCIPVTLRPLPPDKRYCTANQFLATLKERKVVELGNTCFFKDSVRLEGKSEPHPTFNKKFDRLVKMLNDYQDHGYKALICVSNEQQRKRLDKIITTLTTETVPWECVPMPLHRGFIDHDTHLLCFTDHEIFERYHQYSVRDLSREHESMTLKDLFELKPGDYVTHIDYGVGRFSGLEKIESNGHQQEVIRLMYKDNGVLYISIHSLHKISRYVGKDGVPPTLHRLGGTTWQNIKAKTKRQMKDIAKDLIALYAKRKASHGFAFSADSYLQNELEASFIYEDTPDQLKATLDVKGDMESQVPMDRLVCGDVGFGKTEVAIRAAFKAACDSKQVAVLVPSTILAFQHYNTFAERLKGLPVRVDYLNRFRSTKEKRQVLADLAEGKIDILIGTHAITGKDVKFKDLGLLIIDEEQKFGVAVKEKIRHLKVNVDCLTLTATPIPRTLQFSMMGARDLSVIQTPPPNRQPIETQVCIYDKEMVRDAIVYELSRGGQVFYVNNRVAQLQDTAIMLQRLVPQAHIAVAHGQMDGKEVEATLMRFVEGEVDVLVATSIIENGLDIPNANTMIISNAQDFGLSDLHQMRGRVGRSNRKAYCYMMIPSYETLTPEAHKRLQAIEEFGVIGSGFNLAMRDLDIRGAGNILGAEQSGFITEVGYETYQKILNEAIAELKETDFKELFQQEAEETKVYVRECQIDTDLEVLLPDSYVNSSAERLLLYKELNGLSTDEELEAYSARLTDRFGRLPQAAQELVKTITLRRWAKSFGVERIVLRQNRMVCFFPLQQDSPFYKSANFSKVIRLVQSNAADTHLKEKDGRLTLTFDNVRSIQTAIDRIMLLS